MKRILTILVSISIFFMSVNIFSNTTPQTPPPPIGDWDIFDTTVISSSIIVLTGNLTVHPTGSLTLDNVTLIMNCTFDGEFGITVNGTLNIINGSNITAFNPDYEYFFRVGFGANFEIMDSELHECGYKLGEGGINAGLLIQADNTIIKGNLLSNNFITIMIMSSNNTVKNNIFNTHYYGITLGASHDCLISNNTVSDSTSADIFIADSYNITLVNNTTTSTTGTGGITLHSSSYNKIIGNKAISNGRGISLTDGSNNNILINNNASSNIGEGFVFGFSNNNTMINNTANMNARGIDLGISMNTTIENFTVNGNTNVGLYIRRANNTTLKDVTVSDTTGSIAVYLYKTDIINFINSTISNSSQYDFYFKLNSNTTLLNTSYNESKVYFDDGVSSLTAQWFLHVNTTDYHGNPVSNANIRVMDNENGTFSRTFMTGPDGYSRWIIVNESWQNQTQKVYYSPHNITAWNNTLAGQARPFINESKTVTIVLYNATFIDLEPGWNLISLPRIQSDTNLQTVLQSIEGQYDAVQWFDNTDPNDPWKHQKVGKPFGNDLSELNETMGFWIQITQPGDTIFLYNGTQPTQNQTITLYSGWNMVGYPSLTSYNRTEGLNNLTFDDQVDAIWSYDAANQKWEDMGESDYFKIGKGYYIHVKSECEWEVPL